MSQTLQLVDANGDLNRNGLQDFVSQNQIDSAGVDYTVVAITGPQSSGKSTLLNNLVSIQPYNITQNIKAPLAPPTRPPD